MGERTAMLVSGWLQIKGFDKDVDSEKRNTVALMVSRVI